MSFRRKLSNRERERQLARDIARIAESEEACNKNELSACMTERRAVNRNYDLLTKIRAPARGKFEIAGVNTPYPPMFREDTRVGKTLKKNMAGVLKIVKSALKAGENYAEAADLLHAASLTVRRINDDGLSPQHSLSFEAAKLVNAKLKSPFLQKFASGEFIYEDFTKNMIRALKKESSFELRIALLKLLRFLIMKGYWGRAVNDYRVFNVTPGKLVDTIRIGDNIQDVLERL